MDSVKFEVTSWYHNFPKDTKSLTILQPIFAARQLNSQETRKPIGVKISWSFSVNDKLLTALRYKAEEDYISQDKELKDVTLQEVQALVRLSHLKYRKEFDKIKVGFNIKFSIPPYLESDINYQDLLALFRL